MENIQRVTDYFNRRIEDAAAAGGGVLDVER